LSAPIAGRNGRLYVDTSAAADGSAQPIANLNSFSVNQTTDRIETTAFGDQTKTYQVSLKDAQGDFSGFWDPDGTLTQYVTDNVTAGRKFYLYPQAGSAHVGTYWFGTGHFDLTTTLTVGGAAEVSGSWAAATSVGYVQA
jgi:hypothetical protein